MRIATLAVLLLLASTALAREPADPPAETTETTATTETTETTETSGTVVGTLEEAASDAAEEQLQALSLGALLLVRLDTPANVFVDGQALDRRQGRNAVLFGVQPGKHQLEVRSILGDDVLYTGSLRTVDGVAYKLRLDTAAGQMSVAKSKPWDGSVSGKQEKLLSVASEVLERLGDGDLDLPSLGQMLTSGAVSKPSGQSGAAAPAASTARAGVAGVTTVTVNVTSGQLSVYVDGERKAKFMQAGTHSFQLSPGAHQVEFRGFGRSDAFASGTLTATDGDVVVFDVSEMGTAVATEGSDAWAP